MYELTFHLLQNRRLYTLRKYLYSASGQFLFKKYLTDRLRHFEKTTTLFAMELDDQYWSNRYLEHNTGWDAGGITTPLKEYIDQLQHKDIALLIPGCGNSYEAEYLLQKGFTNITLIDISTTLCRQLEEKFSAWLSRGLTIVCGDFFDHIGQYDLVLEQTFFCALDPSRRHSYMSKMFKLLKPGGKLVGVFFNRAFEGGPPFGGDMDEYKSLFLKKFSIEIMDECYNSIPARNGAELFIKLVK